MAIASYIMLVNNYAEVGDRDRILIVIGATILTAIISYFLFPQEGDNPKDRGPYWPNTDMTGNLEIKIRDFLPSLWNFYEYYP